MLLGMFATASADQAPPAQRTMRLALGVHHSKMLAPTSVPGHERHFGHVGRTSDVPPITPEIADVASTRVDLPFNPQTCRSGSPARCRCQGRRREDRHPAAMQKFTRSVEGWCATAQNNGSDCNADGDDGRIAVQSSAEISARKRANISRLIIEGRNNGRHK